jgi:hypothetical protein
LFAFALLLIHIIALITSATQASAWLERTPEHARQKKGGPSSRAVEFPPWVGTKVEQRRTIQEPEIVSGREQSMAEGEGARGGGDGARSCAQLEAGRSAAPSPPRVDEKKLLRGSPGGSVHGEPLLLLLLLRAISAFLRSLVVVFAETTTEEGRRKTQNAKLKTQKAKKQNAKRKTQMEEEWVSIYIYIYIDILMKVYIYIYLELYYRKWGLDSIDA